jgi:hypothetical protein
LKSIEVNIREYIKKSEIISRGDLEIFKEKIVEGQKNFGKMIGVEK